MKDKCYQSRLWTDFSSEKALTPTDITALERHLLVVDEAPEPACNGVVSLLDRVWQNESDPPFELWGSIKQLFFFEAGKVLRTLCVMLAVITAGTLLLATRSMNTRDGELLVLGVPLLAVLLIGMLSRPSAQLSDLRRSCPIPTFLLDLLLLLGVVLMLGIWGTIMTIALVRDSYSLVQIAAVAISWLAPLGMTACLYLLLSKRLGKVFTFVLMAGVWAVLVIGKLQHQWPVISVLGADGWGLEKGVQVGIASVCVLVESGALQRWWRNRYASR